jgi:hypothetical protein
VLTLAWGGARTHQGERSGNKGDGGVGAGDEWHTSTTPAHAVNPNAKGEAKRPFRKYDPRRLRPGLKLGMPPAGYCYIWAGNFRRWQVSSPPVS